jgi:hypothetical protein
MLEDDWFRDNPTQRLKTFRHCFRMNEELFLKIVHGLRDYEDYFVCKRDCTGLLGFTSERIV